MKKKMSFEEAMNRLEEIARALDTGDLPLEESIKMFEEGMQLIEFCQARLEEAEKKVQKLSRSDDGSFQTSPLDATPDDSANEES